MCNSWETWYADLQGSLQVFLDVYICGSQNNFVEISDRGSGKGGPLVLFNIIVSSMLKKTGEGIIKRI